MKYRVDNDMCICCGACAAECPEDALFQDEKHYRIDILICNGCGMCIDVCPMDCISQTETE